MIKIHKLQQFHRNFLNLQIASLPVFNFYKAKIVWLANAGFRVGKGSKKYEHTQFYGNGLIEIGENIRRVVIGIAKEINIADGCFNGTRVTFFYGVNVRKRSIFGAEALVNENIPEYCTAVGIAAHV